MNKVIIAFIILVTGFFAQANGNSPISEELANEIAQNCRFFDVTYYDVHNTLSPMDQMSSELTCALSLQKVDQDVLKELLSEDEWNWYQDLIAEFNQPIHEVLNSHLGRIDFDYNIPEDKRPQFL